MTQDQRKALRDAPQGPHMTQHQLPPLPEADTYQYQHEETGRTMFVDRQQVEWGFEVLNPRLHKIGGAYTADQMQAYALAAIEHSRTQVHADVSAWLESQRIDGGAHGFECVGVEALGRVWGAAVSSTQVQVSDEQIIECALAAGFAHDPSSNAIWATDGYVGTQVTRGLRKFARAILALRPAQASENPLAASEADMAVYDSIADRYFKDTAQATTAQGEAAKAWSDGYKHGVEDERESEANIGVAGFGAKVAPARNNPYLAPQPTQATAAQAGEVESLRTQVDILKAAVESRGKTIEQMKATAAQGEPSPDWRTPTTYAERFTHAVALLCGKAPPDHMVADWIAGNDGGLQGFAASNGPAWCQGIGLLDAAHVIADQPTEGVNHEMRAQPAPVVADGMALVPIEPTVGMMEAMPSLPAIGAPGDMELKAKGWSLKAIQNRHRWAAALAAAQKGGE